MPNLRLSGLWAQIPWRRRKDEPTESISAKRKINVPLRDWRPFSRGGEGTHRAVTDSATVKQDRRLSRIWETEDISEASPTRRLSASYRRFTRSFEPPTSDPASSIAEAEPRRSDAFATDESLLKRLQRKSQTFSLPRPRTSSGIPRRRSFWSTKEADNADISDVPILPPLTELQQGSRPRHVPITIDYLQMHLEGDSMPNRGVYSSGPGLPSISSTTHTMERSSSTNLRDRPLSFSSSLGQLRQRTSLFSSHRTIPEDESEVSADEHDLITALPALADSELRRPTSMSLASKTYSDSTYAPAGRQIFERATPKVIDILAPQPMTMISASSTPKVRSRPSTSNGLPTLDRRQRTFQPPETEMNDEDGPKGDWARTRHSWLSMENATGTGGSEQMEWDKLKQFIEAYSGGGGDNGVISIRQVDDSSDSSGSSTAKPVMRYSNAQALAALEFGLA